MRNHRRSTTVRCLLAIAIAFFPVAAANAQGTVNRPNIVFILADDLGINDLACYGRKEHKTPNIDKLAERGIRFTNAYSAASLGAPSRAASLTGQSPTRLKSDSQSDVGIVAQFLPQSDSNDRLPNGIKALPQRLKEAHYKSAFFGSPDLWQVGPTWKELGFDLALLETLPPPAEGILAHALDVTAHFECAEKFIDDNRNRPFFLVAKFPRTTTAELDRFVGRLIGKLDALKLLDDTLVVFISASGVSHVEGFQASPSRPPRQTSPFRAGMGFLYEGGVRIPLIVSWPAKVKAGQVADAPAISMDLTPTALSAAGLAPVDTIDGINLLDQIAPGKAPATRPLFWHQPYYTFEGGRPSGAIREGFWKLIEHYENGACELYNLDRDIGEANDLSAREPSRVADLRGKLEKWRRDVDAGNLRPNPNYNPSVWKELYGNIDISQVDVGKAVAAEKLIKWHTKMGAYPRNSLKAFKVPPQCGVALLQGKDALVHGDKLRYEPQPQKDTLGFWVNKNDWLEWKFTPPHKGVFEVELLQACGKGSGGAEIEVTVAGQTLAMKVEDTGHFQRFVPRTIGTVKLNEGEEVTLAVRAKTKPGPAVMDLRRIVLRAAP